MNFDFHTHRLDAPAGKAIINMPLSAIVRPESFALRPGALYSVGVHPWWISQLAAAGTDVPAAMKHVAEWLAESPQVVAVGEAGLDAVFAKRAAAEAFPADAMRAAEEKQRLLDAQAAVFEQHVALSEAAARPLTIHCVRAFDALLAIRRRLRPAQRWTVHGFRGNPQQARQLLAAGLCLSFGRQRNEESFRLTPPDRRFEETDDEA